MVPCQRAPKCTPTGSLLAALPLLEARGLCMSNAERSSALSSLSRRPIHNQLPSGAPSSPCPEAHTPL